MIHFEFLYDKLYMGIHFNPYGSLVYHPSQSVKNEGKPTDKRTPSLEISGIPIPVEPFILWYTQFPFENNMVAPALVHDPWKAGSKIDLTKKVKIPLKPDNIIFQDPESGCRMPDAKKDPFGFGEFNARDGAELLGIISELNDPSVQPFSKALIAGYLCHLSDPNISEEIGINNMPSSVSFLNYKRQLTAAPGVNRNSDSVADFVFIQAGLRFAMMQNLALSQMERSDLLALLPHELASSLQDRDPKGFFVGIASFYLGKAKAKYIKELHGKLYMTISEDLKTLDQMGQFYPSREAQGRLTLTLANFRNDMLMELGLFDKANQDSWLQIRKNLFDVGVQAYHENGFIPDQCQISVEDSALVIKPDKLLRNKLFREGRDGITFYLEVAQAALFDDSFVGEQYQLKKQAFKFLELLVTSDDRFKMDTSPQTLKMNFPYVPTSVSEKIVCFVNYAYHACKGNKSQTKEYENKIKGLMTLKMTSSTSPEVYGKQGVETRPDFQASMLLFKVLSDLGNPQVKKNLSETDDQTVRRIHPSWEDVSNPVLQGRNEITLRNDLYTLMENPDSPAEIIVRTAIDYIAYLPTDIATLLYASLEKGSLTPLARHLKEFSRNFKCLHGENIIIPDKYKSQINVLKMRNASDFFVQGGSSENYVETSSRIGKCWWFLINSWNTLPENIDGEKSPERARYSLASFFNNVLVRDAKLRLTEQVVSACLEELDLLSFTRLEDKVNVTAGLILKVIGFLEGELSSLHRYDDMPSIITALLDRPDIFGKSKENNVYLRLTLVRALRKLKENIGTSSPTEEHYKVFSQLVACREILFNRYTHSAENLYRDHDNFEEWHGRWHFMGREKQVYVRAEQYIAWITEVVHYLEHVNLHQLALYYINKALGLDPYQNVNQKLLADEQKKLTHYLPSDEHSLEEVEALRKLLEQDQLGTDIDFIRKTGLLVPENDADLLLLRGTLLASLAQSRTVPLQEPVCNEFYIGTIPVQINSGLSTQFLNISKSISELESSLNNRQNWLNESPNRELISARYQKLFASEISVIQNENATTDQLKKIASDPHANEDRRMAAIYLLWTSGEHNILTSIINDVLGGGGIGLGLFDLEDKNKKLVVYVSNFNREIHAINTYADVLNHYEFFSESFRRLADAYAEKARILKDILDMIPDEQQKIPLQKEHDLALTYAQLVALTPSSCQGNHGVVRSKNISQLFQARKTYESLLKEYNQLADATGENKDRPSILRGLANRYTLDSRGVLRNNTTSQRRDKDQLGMNFKRFQIRFDALARDEKLDSLVNWQELIQELLQVDEENFWTSDNALLMYSKWLPLIIQAYLHCAKSSGATDQDISGCSTKAFVFTAILANIPVTVETDHSITLNGQNYPLKFSAGELNALKIFSLRQENLTKEQLSNEHVSIDNLYQNSMLFKRVSVSELTGIRNSLPQNVPIESAIHELLNDVIRSLPDVPQLYFLKALFLAYSQSSQEKQTALRLIDTYLAPIHDSELTDYSQFFWANFFHANLSLELLRQETESIANYKLQAEALAPQMEEMFAVTSSLIDQNLLLYLSTKNEITEDLSEMKITNKDDKVLLFSYSLAILDQICSLYNLYTTFIMDIELAPDIKNTLKGKIDYFTGIANDIYSVIYKDNPPHSKQLKSDNFYVEILRNNQDIFKSEWIKSCAHSDSLINLDKIERHLQDQKLFQLLSKEDKFSLQGICPTPLEQNILPYQHLLRLSNENSIFVIALYNPDETHFIHSIHIAEIMDRAIKAGDTALFDRYYKTFQYLLSKGADGLPAQLINFSGEPQNLDEFNYKLDGRKTDIHATLIFVRALWKGGKTDEARTLLRNVVSLEKTLLGNDTPVDITALDIQLFRDCGLIDAENRDYWDKKAESALSILNGLFSEEKRIPDWIYVQVAKDGTLSRALASLSVTRIGNLFIDIPNCPGGIEQYTFGPGTAPHQGYMGYKLLLNLANTNPDDPLYSEIKDLLEKVLDQADQELAENTCVLVEREREKEAFPDNPVLQGFHSLIPYQVYSRLSLVTGRNKTYSPPLPALPSILQAPRNRLTENLFSLEGSGPRLQVTKGRK